MNPWIAECTKRNMFILHIVIWLSPIQVYLNVKSVNTKQQSLSTTTTLYPSWIRSPRSRTCSTLTASQPPSSDFKRKMKRIRFFFTNGVGRLFGGSVCSMLSNILRTALHAGLSVILRDRRRKPENHEIENFSNIASPGHYIAGNGAEVA